MANRRQALSDVRRKAHMQLRRQGIIHQESDSSMEGPKGGGSPQRAAKAWKARRA